MSKGAQFDTFDTYTALELELADLDDAGDEELAEKNEAWQAWLDAREDEEYHELKMVLTAMAEWLPEMVAVRADTAVKMSRNRTQIH